MYFKVTLWKIFIYSFNSEFEDEKGVTISHKSKYRKYNDQKKTSQQNTTQRTTDRAISTQQIMGNEIRCFISVARRITHASKHF